jgi:PAS domain S-box-containing protein
MAGRSLYRRLTTSSMLPIVAAALAMGIFIVDTITPLDIAVAVLYAVVVLMAGAYFQRRGVLLVSTGCLALTVSSFLLSHGLSDDRAILRCLVSLAAITITTVLALKNQSADRELRKQANLLNLTHDTVFVRDMKDVITYWNRGAAESYGWQREEALGKVSHQLMQTIFPTPLEEIMATLLGTGRWEGELVHTKRDGTQVIVDSRWSLEWDKQARPVGILETNNDITERKKADAELRESERRYRNIFQAAGVCICEEDFSSVKAVINELRAQGVEDFARHLAERREFVRRAMAMMRIVDVNDATLKLMGAQTTTELLASRESMWLPESEDAFAGILVAIAEGRASFESETVLQTLRGDRVVVLLTITFPPESANLETVLVSIIDITERRKAQDALQQAQVELAHVTRVTTLGELTASIAHEVNQPLAAVVTNGEACLRWLGRDVPQLDEVRLAVERMIGEGRRASEVVWRLRALARKTDPHKTLLDLNDVIDDVVLLVQREVMENRILLRLDLAPALPMVLGDRVQLQQVIINLAINAIQAMAPVADRLRQLIIRARPHGADQVLIAVQDTGTGIEPGTADQLFKTFFTTKPTGMGMGLSICRSIVESHGGRVWVSGNDGRGATFQFTLPSSRESAG